MARRLQINLKNSKEDVKAEATDREKIVELEQKLEELENKINNTEENSDEPETV